jgi:transcriptional regulator with XRE-family HTH domain
MSAETETRPWHDAATLKRLFHEEGLTQAEIAERLGCAERSVRRWMHKHDVSTDRTQPWQDADTLERLYIEADLTRAEVAARLGCKPTTIEDWLAHHDIQKSGTRPHHDAATLRRLYHEEGLTQAEIAARFDVTQRAIWGWMDEHDIETAGRGAANRYDRDELIEHLRQVNAECEFRITQADLNESDGPSETPYQTRFESWEAALEAAGIDPDAPTRPTATRETLDGDMGQTLTSNPQAARELLRVEPPFRRRDLNISDSLFYKFRSVRVIEHASERPTQADDEHAPWYSWEWQPAPDVRGWIREHIDPAGTCPAADCEATGVSNPRGVEGYRCSSETCDYDLNRREAREVLGG